MLNKPKPFCPDCAETVDQPAVVDRRQFIRVLGGSAAYLTLGKVPAVATANDARPDEKPAKPAEELVKELHATLSNDQKKELILPWDHGKESGTPTRLRMYNSPIAGKQIGTSYTKAQQELIDRIIHAISSGEDGYRRLSRGGTWDTRNGMGDCGAVLFGDLAEGKKWSWVFTGHHLTVRCDGNSEEGAAFGGPMFYGHSPNGYSSQNVFNYQTKSVLSVHDALSEKQRKVAVITGTPGEQARSVQLKPRDPKPGLSFGEMNKNQQVLVEKVMREILSPYRKEDADEVMAIIKATGGLEKIHLAFYRDQGATDNERWHFWRLEGPGFVWNYRVLPHVHTYVNISSKI